MKKLIVAVLLMSVMAVPSFASNKTTVAVFNDTLFANAALDSVFVLTKITGRTAGANFKRDTVYSDPVKLEGTTPTDDNNRLWFRWFSIYNDTILNGATSTGDTFAIVTQHSFLPTGPWSKFDSFAVIFPTSSGWNRRDSLYVSDTVRINLDTTAGSMGNYYRLRVTRCATPVVADTTFARLNPRKVMARITAYFFGR